MTKIIMINMFVSLAHKDFGHFYGSSYVAAPDGSRTPVSKLQTIIFITIYSF